jgi:hypothetical protein
MDSISPEKKLAYFGFHDLHSFKDFVGFVRLCAPDQFPHQDWLKPDEQWTLDRAFEGLRYGLDLTAQEKGELPVLATCRSLVKEAYVHYTNGRMREGYFKIEEMEKLLRKIPSH